MNYGQVLDTLKAHPLDAGVKLRGADGSFDIDDVTHSKIEPDQAAPGFGLFTQGGAPGNPLDAPPVKTVADLLMTCRAIDGDKPDFTEPVTICTPHLRGVEINQTTFDDGVLYFDALEQKLGAPTDEELAQQFGPGESLGTGAPVPLIADHVAAKHQPLSPPAAGVLDQIGLGMRLRVPFDQSPATLVDGVHALVGGDPKPESGPIGDDVVQELIACGLLHKLTKDGVPPVKDRTGAKGEGFRRGWDELGLDGDEADFYCVQ